MEIKSMRQVISTVNDRTKIKIYRGGQLVTWGNWYQDNILEYMDKLRVSADLDEVKNICRVELDVPRVL